MNSLPLDIKKIIAHLASESVYNINLRKLCSSMNSVGQDITIYTNIEGIDTIAEIKPFIISDMKYGRDDDIVMNIEEKESRSTVRISLTISTIKQLIRILMSMHGLKGTVRVNGTEGSFRVTVSDIRRSDYEEVYYPMVDVMGGDMKRFFRESKFIKLSSNLIDPHWGERILDQISS